MEQKVFNPADYKFTTRFREALEIENAKRPLFGEPIDGYDEQKNAPYLEFPDGRRIYEVPKD